VLVDMEASVEHMRRATVRHVETLLVVTEPYFRALQSAGRLIRLARGLGIPRILGVANKVRTSEEEAAIRTWLDRLEADGIGLADVLLPSDEIDRLLAGRCSLDFIASARRKIDAAVEELAAAHESIDSSLIAAWRKTGASLRRPIDLFERRVVAAAARSDEVLQGRVRRLREHCLPNGKLQEREFTSLHCQASWGRALARALRSIDLDPRHLQALSLACPASSGSETAAPART